MEKECSSPVSVVSLEDLEVSINVTDIKLTYKSITQDITTCLLTEISKRL